MTTPTDQHEHAEEKPAKGRGGAPLGNLNALRNGSRVNAKRLVVGELPTSMVAVKREACAYRRDREAEVLDAKGAIDSTDAHLIDTAAAATAQAALCRWLLRNRLSKMTVADIRGCGSDIVRAKQCRDGAIRALRLNQQAIDPWQSLTSPGSPPELQAAITPHVAHEGRTGVHDGDGRSVPDSGETASAGHSGDDTGAWGQDGPTEPKPEGAA